MLFFWFKSLKMDDDFRPCYYSITPFHTTLNRYGTGSIAGNHSVLLCFYTKVWIPESQKPMHAYTKGKAESGKKQGQSINLLFAA